MKCRESVHHEHTAECERTQRGRLVSKQQKRKQKKRKPHRPDEMQMGQVVKSEADERERDATDHPCDKRSSRITAQGIHRQSAAGEAKQDANVVDRQRREAEEMERKKRNGQADHVLAERERVARRASDKKCSR